jgi:hypothetical protein
VIPAQKSRDLLHRKAAHEHVAKLGQLRIRPFPCGVHGRRFGVSVSALWIEHQGTNQAQERDLFGTSRAAEERTDFDITLPDRLHTESRCSVRDVGVVPGQQFATAHLSLIGVNSEKHRVTKRVAVQASGAEPLST